MPGELPTLEQRDGWQDSLDELEALGVPRTWLLIGPLPDTNRKQFESASGPDRTDDWTAFRTVRWTRPNDEEGCEVDLTEVLGRGRNVMAHAQTEVDWPLEGPALIWFDAPGRAVVYLNNVEMDAPQPRKKRALDAARDTLYPIPVQMRRGRNSIKVKVASTDDRKGDFGFSLRLERNDTPYREQLLARLRELYPEEAAGWRGTEALMELARRYESATRFQDALSIYQKISDAFPDNEDYLAEMQEARRRMLTPRGEAPAQGTEPWKAVEEQFRTLVQEAETLRADRLLRDFVARHPLNPNTGTALCWRGALRQDYALSRECRPFFERAVREFGQDETVRKYAVRGIAYARQYRPETPEVPVKHDVQLLVDAARRQISAGNPDNIAAALRSFDSILRRSGDALLRISDSPFAPRYAGVREYVRALLGHLAGEPLAQYRTTMARAAEEQFQQARTLGSVVDLEAAAWEYYYTPGAAKALNQAGNLYMDRGAYSQAAAVFRLLLRDYRDGPAAPSAAAAGDQGRGGGLLG
ncbi:MAG: hypothetical protein NTW87_37230, partial [Planctomycetota bacterium]|nr:hypothetical protein [Planctomycetota bacterium]